MEYPATETTEQILQRELSKANREIGRLTVRLEMMQVENEKLKNEKEKLCFG